MWLLDALKSPERFYTLHSPADLNEPGRMRAMFDHFGLETKDVDIALPNKKGWRSSKNENFGRKTTVSVREEDEFAAIVEAMPRKYLEVFHREPYAGFSWIEMLQR